MRSWLQSNHKQKKKTETSNAGIAQTPADNIKDRCVEKFYYTGLHQQQITAYGKKAQDAIPLLLSL